MPEPPAKWLPPSDPAAVTAVEPWFGGGAALAESTAAEQREVDDGVKGGLCFRHA
jgi:hypothetical protein